MSRAGADGARAHVAHELLEAHFDRVYGLLCLLAADREQAARAVSAAFGAACGSFAERPGPDDELQRWLLLRAVEELPRPSREPGSGGSAASRAASRRAERARPVAGGDALAGISDETLRVLVRTLDPAERLHVTLRLMGGLSAEEVGRVAGVSTAESERLVKRGAERVAERLEADHERGRHSSAALASKPAPHLRPLPAPASDGVIVVRGDRAHAEHGPAASLADAVRVLLERIAAWLRRGHGGTELDDDVGPASAPRAPDPTPTLRPFRRPKPTPSMREYRKPSGTPGTADHRSPKGTPSTARLSNPSRPLSRGAAVYGARAKRW